MTMTHEPQLNLVQHHWVKHTVTPVSTLPDLDDDRQIVVIEDEQANKEAEANAVYGCHRCGVPMQGNTDSLCPVDPMCHCGANLSDHNVTDNHSFKEML